MPSGFGVVLRYSLIPNCIENLPPIARSIVVGAMDYCVMIEQEEVPVRTGDLRRSIHSSMTGQTSGYVRAGGGEIDYAVYQEYGTSHHAANPFVRPAADATAMQYGYVRNIEGELLS